MSSIGIYIIYFSDPQKCYIGQSVNVETRLRKHREMLLAANHYNYKLQQEYNILGILPSMDLLEECKPSELNSLEVAYIKEFDSVNSGFNILSGGSVPIGYESSRSKYTREELLSAFLLLANDTLTNKDIVNITELPSHVIECIAYNRRHKWLSEEFPEVREKINIIINNNTRSALCNDYNARNGIVYSVISPTGEEHTFSNIARFADSKGLNRSHLNQVILGKEKQHKGWRKGVQNVL